MLNIVGRPIGVITNEVWQTQYSFNYWVRLEDGTLLKDVEYTEFEEIK